MQQKVIIFISILLSCTTTFADNTYVKSSFSSNIQAGVPGSHKGDIIAPQTDTQIAKWCDFSKQIVITNTKVLCVYVGKSNLTP